MRYAKWPHYPHDHITHLSPSSYIDALNPIDSAVLLYIYIGTIVHYI